MPRGNRQAATPPVRMRPEFSKGSSSGEQEIATWGTTPPNSDHVTPEGLRSRVRSRGLIRTRFRPLVGRERTVTPMNKLLTVEELSTCIHKSVASIRSDATRNPPIAPTHLPPAGHQTPSVALGGRGAMVGCPCCYNAASGRC